MMFGRHAKNEEPLRCSFCNKPENVVRKLIPSPRDHSLFYICDECVSVCNSILEDDPDHSKSEDVSAQLEEKHPLIDQPIASQVLTAVERWIQQESSGAEASEELAELRGIAIRLLYWTNDRTITTRHPPK